MYIQINERISPLSCHFCSQRYLSQIATVKDAPAFLGCTLTNPPDDLFLSFQLYICRQCGLIQSDATPLDTTYADLHSEALGPTWELHHKEFALFIESKITDSSMPLKILELGASSQPISQKLKTCQREVWYIDPIKVLPFKLSRSEHYLSGFFPSVKPSHQVDLIIASHVFEHIPATFNFLNAIKDQLTPNGLFVISIPQFKTWFEKSYFNAISAEHIVYPFEQQLRFLAKNFSLSVEVENFQEHSLFAAFYKNRHEDEHFHKKPLDTIKILKDWIRSFNSSISLPDYDDNVDSGKHFVTGASHLSQYFLLSNPGLGKKIVGVLDNSSKKWGQRLYGTNARACSFEKLRSFSSPIVYLTPSPYSQEMRKQILQINSATTIIEIGDRHVPYVKSKSD